MAETIIRPTMKFIHAGYAAALLAVIALCVAALTFGWPPLIAWFSPLLLLWPLKCHVQNRMTRITILDDKLRYDTGFTSKTTRTILLSKIQDLTVHQSLAQRVFGVGNLSIETAGETSKLTIAQIDKPQNVADRIHELGSRK